jgi:hypothetical protein
LSPVGALSADWVHRIQSRRTRSGASVVCRGARPASRGRPRKHAIAGAAAQWSASPSRRLGFACAVTTSSTTQPSQAARRGRRLSGRSPRPSPVHPYRHAGTGRWALGEPICVFVGRLEHSSVHCDGCSLGPTSTRSSLRTWSGTSSNTAQPGNSQRRSPHGASLDLPRLAPARVSRRSLHDRREPAASPGDGDDPAVAEVNIGRSWSEVCLVGRRRSSVRGCRGGTGNRRS